MASISESDIERLKTEVSLIRLIESSGAALKKTGKDWACRCPFHEGFREFAGLHKPNKNHLRL